MKRISSGTNVIRRASLSPFPDHFILRRWCKKKKEKKKFLPQSQKLVRREKRARTNERRELELVNEGKKKNPACLAGMLLMLAVEK